MNLIDIGPQYAGHLLGISNTFATIPGFVGNVTVGWILDATNQNWGVVFLLVACVYCIGAVAFLVMAKGHNIFQNRELDSENIHEQELLEHTVTT